MRGTDVLEGFPNAAIGQKPKQAGTVLFGGSQVGNDIWSRDQVWSKHQPHSKRVNDNEAPPLWKSARLPSGAQSRIVHPPS